MISMVLTMMAWGNVAVAADLPQQEVIPRTRQEALNARKNRLRSRFDSVKSQFEKKSAEERNRDFFANLARPSLRQAAPEEMRISPVAAQDVLVAEIKENYIPQNILVVAPHPDDEILCCSATISDHLAAGDKVSIVVITDGDGKERGNAEESLNYGEVRREETLLAAQKLGISADDIMFLGFPDGHLTELEKKFRARSSFTQLMSTIQTSLFPGTPYTWGGLQHSLRQVLERTEPGVIYLPGEFDVHPDHKVAGRAVKKAAAVLKFAPEFQEYSVHFKHNEPANEPVCEKKLELIRVFKSQRHDAAHIQYLDEFAFRKEMFR